MPLRTYLCVDGWCEHCKARIYRKGRQLNEDEYKENNFIINNPRIIVIGNKCCDCGKNLTIIKQHVTCDDSYGEWWYRDVHTVDYEYNPSYGKRWYRCNACAMKRNPNYKPNSFPILGLESGKISFCQCRATG